VPAIESYEAHISPIEWSNVILYGEYKLNRDLVSPNSLAYMYGGIGVESFIVDFRSTKM